MSPDRRLILATLGGAVIVAAALLLAFRWQVAAGPMAARVILLDRWTGNVTSCVLQPSNRFVCE